MYETLYDVRQVIPIDWEFLAVGTLFIGIGVLNLARPNSWPFANKPRWFGIVWLGFAILWTALSIGLPLSNQYVHASALNDGDIRVVEGPIEGFSSSSDCKREQFSVGGHSFEYSKYEDLGRFNRPAPCGGPLRPGMLVRISYTGEDDIVKLETHRATTPH